MLQYILNVWYIYCVVNIPIKLLCMYLYYECSAKMPHWTSGN